MSKPFEEYQGTVHFSNQKGIRAECAANKFMINIFRCF
ncbi:NapC/NirT family cytochrome c [Escherichia coli]